MADEVTVSNSQLSAHETRTLTTELSNIRYQKEMAESRVEVERKRGMDEAG